MGWSASQYSEYFRSSDQGSYIKGLYSHICAEMQREYGQWASNLMLEYDIRKSNLHSPYTESTAPLKVQERAQLRMKFLTLLYEHLPESEERIFGDFLSPTRLQSGMIPDIAGAYTLYKLQDAHHLISEHFSKELQDLPASQRIEAYGLAPFLATREVENFVSQTIGIEDVNRDSLFARLLLNTMVNRNCLENEEYDRLNTKAAMMLKDLLMQLIAEFGVHLPLVYNNESIRAVVLRAMSRPATKSWRPLTENVFSRVLQRGLILKDIDPLLRVNKNKDAAQSHSQELLLGVLAVAWSYCTRDTHDTQITGVKHREHDVINGRDTEVSNEYAPALRAYHRRQFCLLVNSGQAYKLSQSNLHSEHIRTMAQRLLFLKLMKNLKSRPVRDWILLDNALSESLKGTKWDELPPFVLQASLK
jgi:hypothetical protein